MAQVLNASEHRWGARVGADIPACVGGGAGDPLSAGGGRMLQAGFVALSTTRLGL